MLINISQCVYLFSEYSDLQNWFLILGLKMFQSTDHVIQFWRFYSVNLKLTILHSTVLYGSKLTKRGTLPLMLTVVVADYLVNRTISYWIRA